MLKKIFSTSALLALMFTWVGCSKTPEDDVTGRWEVVGVEYKGEFTSIEDRLSLALIPGTKNLTSTGFEMKAGGKYRSGESTGTWSLIHPGVYQIAYDVHGKDYKVKIEYERDGSRLKIRRPDGDLWIVLK